MKAYLLKEYYQNRFGHILYVIVCVIVMLAGIFTGNSAGAVYSPILTISCLMVSMFAMTVFTNDERDRSRVMMALTPVKPRSLVNCRYLKAVAFPTVMIALNVIAVFTGLALGGWSISGHGIQLLFSAALSFAAAVIPTAILYPLYFRFSAEKVGIIQGIVAFLAISVIMPLILAQEAFDTPEGSFVCIGLLAGSAVLLLLSYLASLDLCQRRDL